MTEVLWLVMMPAIVVVVTAGLSARLRPAWSRRRAVLSACLPVPVLVTLPCLWVLARTVTLPQERCGVDACGMAMAAALAGLAYAAAALVAGAIIAAAIARAAERS